MRGKWSAFAVAAMVLAPALGSVAPALAAPGDRDPGWGKQGIAYPPGGPALRELVPTPDGGAIYLARAEGDLQGPVGIRKLTRNGLADTDFGTNGVADVPSPLGVTAIDVAPDGRVLAGGFIGSPSRPGAARLLADGSLDTSFGSAGIATSNVGGSPSGVTSVNAEPGGGAALAIYVGTSSSQMGILRLTSQGDPDPSFGTNGLTELVGGRSPEIARDASGRYLLGSGFDIGELPTVVRINPDGGIDRSFGTGGYINLPQPLGIFTGRVTALAADAGGRVLALYSGSDRASTHSGGYNRLVRLDANGSVDTSFKAEFPTSEDQTRVFDAADMVLDDSGRLVVAGSWVTTRYVGGAADPAIVRLMPGGKPDQSFGQKGLAVVPTLEINAGAKAGYLEDVALDPHGDVLGFGGWSDGGFQNPLAIRLLAGSGRGDADADGTADRKDRCRLVTGPKKRAGCPLLDRSVTILREQDNSSVHGQVIGLPGCVRHQHLRLARAVPGPDDVVGSLKLNNQDWAIKGPFVRGRYYAEVARARNGEVGICEAARSPVVTLGPAH